MGRIPDIHRRRFLQLAARSSQSAVALAATGLPLEMLLVAGEARAAPDSVLRIAMTAGDVPTATGMPNNGFEGMRFLGYPAFEPLIDWDLRQTESSTKIRPALATEWFSDPADRTRWVFKLRPNVKFHDGSAFNADAVVWNLARFYDEKAPQYEIKAAPITKGRVPFVARWEKVDDLTVAIYTTRPISYFPYQVTMILMASPVSWEKSGRDWNVVAKVGAAGTGPFRITKVTPPISLELTRNDDHWNKDRIPKTSRVVLTPMPESTTRLSALRSGQVDWIELPPPDSIPSLKQSKFQVQTGIYPHIWSYMLKTTKGSVFSDKRVRQAANYAVDRDALVEFLSGTARPAVGFWPKEHPNFGNPQNTYAYDPERAKALLKQAGHDKPIKIKVQISTSGSGQMLPVPMNELIQQSMAAAGFELEFDVLDYGQLVINSRLSPDSPTLKSIDAHNFALMATDYSFLYRWFHSDNFTPISNNWMHWKNEEFDRLLDSVGIDFDHPEQNPNITRAHELLVDEAPCVWIVHDLNARAFVPTLKGYIPAQSWVTDFTGVSLG
jgi:peptide/nickel transport system substrate-binding protein